MHLEIGSGSLGLWGQLLGARGRNLRRRKCIRRLSPPGALVPNCETRTNRCLRRGGLVLPGRLLGLGSETGDRAAELAIVALIFQKSLRSVSSFFPCHRSSRAFCPWVAEEILPSSCGGVATGGPALRKIALPDCVLNRLKGDIVRFYLVMPPPAAPPHCTRQTLDSCPSVSPNSDSRFGLLLHFGALMLALDGL